MQPREMKLHSGHLTKAATILFTRFKSPSRLLQFLSDAITWVKNYDDEKQIDSLKSHHFSVVLLMSEIVCKWVDSHRDPIKGIKHGLLEVVDFLGSDGYDDCVKNIFDSYGLYLKDGLPTQKHHKECIDGINALLELHIYIYEINNELRPGRVAA